jgi:hypothetical protein
MISTVGAGAKNRIPGRITAILWTSVDQDFQTESLKQVHFLHLQTKMEQHCQIQSGNGPVSAMTNTK